MTFKVHFADGQKLIVTAANPDEARKIAMKQVLARFNPITKIKRAEA